METLQTLWWDDGTGAVHLIDQTRLPLAFRVIRCRTVDRLIMAIQRLEVRGAPALGIAGAYGVALAAGSIRERDLSRFLQILESEAMRIGNARPTAVNLSWGVRRVLEQARRAQSPGEARMIARQEAKSVADEDAAGCHALGEFGASLLPDEGVVLTHCNAGALACREWGTALGVVRSAVQAGKTISVIASETRPLLQGARLTAWELARDGIPVTVIPDSAAAHLMRRNEIDCVVVGADRITPDVVFNKVGTYMHALCAGAHGIPFFVAAPGSTFDPDHAEDQIEIEERGREEVARFSGRITVPEGVPVRTPAFDATPLSLVTALITDKGIIRPAEGWARCAVNRGVI